MIYRCFPNFPSFLSGVCHLPLGFEKRGNFVSFEVLLKTDKLTGNYSHVSGRSLKITVLLFLLFYARPTRFVTFPLP